MKQQNSPHRLPIVLTAFIVVVLLLVAVTSPNDEPDTTPPPEASESGPSEPSLPVAREIELAMPDARDGSIWELDDVGARLVKPETWTVGETTQRKYLARDPEDWHAGSVNQIKLPNFFGHDVEGLLQENLDEIANNPAFRLLDSQRLRINGRDVLRFDYTGKNEQFELRIVCTTYLYGSQKIAITWAARAEDWPAIEDDVEEAISTMWVRPIKTGSK